MEIKVVVAAHKPYRMPEAGVYVPLQVGASGKAPIRAPGGSADFLRDDAGDGISGRNPNWCELTGLYWAWKNLDADVLGLVHYRRHFRGARGIATGAELAALFDSGVEAVLPKKRNYFIETTYSQYVHAHHREDLDVTREIVAERDPSGLWESNMFGRSLYDLLNDGLHAKLEHMPPDARRKFGETLSKIINEGSQGLICIIL